MNTPRYILKIEGRSMLLPASVKTSDILMILTSLEGARTVDDMYLPRTHPDVCIVDYIRDRAPEVTIQLTAREFVTEAEADVLRKKEDEARAAAAGS